MCVGLERAPHTQRRKVRKNRVADKDQTIKVVVYDTHKLTSMIVGNTIMLINYELKTTPETSLSITAKRKVMKTSPIDVTELIQTAAENITNPPTAKIIPLEQVKLSPVKMLVSVKGKIVSEELARKMNVRNNEVQVKTVTVKSGSEEVNLTLWRDMTARKLMGQFFKFENVVVNSYRNEVSLNPIARTQIEPCDEPTTTAVGNLIGFETNELTISLMLEINEEFASYDVTKETIMKSLELMRKRI